MLNKVALLLFFMLFLGAWTMTESLPAEEESHQEMPMIDQNNACLVDTAGNPVILAKNPNAVNPSLQQVIDFARQTRISSLKYQPGKFVCTEFAKLLHDKAQAVGYRCAFVSVHFKTGMGHALTAFRTTDFGLVFVDCTGGISNDEVGAYDTFGYLERGKPYGRLPFDVGRNDPNHYERYEQALSTWANIEELKDYIQNTKEDIEVKKTALQKEQQYLSQYNGKELSQAAASVVQQRGANYNQRMTQLQQEIDSLNKKVVVYNYAQKTLQHHYTENPAPVTDFTIWW